MKMCKNGGKKMALRNYIMHNKKKVSAVTAILLVAIVVIIAIAHFNIGTKADVFKQDSDGNMQSKSEVNILEVVAEYGQQVIGYTVSGYEPITKEQIENYHGDIDIEDFRAATGYELNKSGSGDGNCRYTVASHTLKNVFNKNVLGDSMSEGQIIVTVCQANEVTTDMINNADLVYLNSNNYSENLFYYYDQIVNNGEKEVELGDTGADYNDYDVVQVLKTEASLKKIQEACGRTFLSSSLIEKDFILAGIESFKAYNLDAYIAKIATLDKGALTAATNEDSIAAIDALISNVNVSEKTNAVSYIKSCAGNTDITEEQKTELIKAFLKAQLANCLEANYDDYINTIINNTLGYVNASAIQSMITNRNANQMGEAIKRLTEFKDAGENNGDLSIVEKDIAKIAYGGIKLELLAEYAAEFATDSFRFTNKSNVASCNTDLKALIDRINAKKKEEALNLIADAPANEDSMALLQENPLFYFKLANIEGFNEYNLDNYMNALSALEDVNSLKGSNSISEENTEATTVEETTSVEETTITEETTSAEETSVIEEETTEPESATDDNSKDTTYVYDYDKIKDFIEKVNSESTYMDQNQSFDISWENAMALYNYAIVDECGLMYDTQLLTSGKIGDFTQNIETNTNNLYKVLLLMIQLQSEYCINSILPKIDENGVYNNEQNAWYKNTFYQEGSNDYKRYREPNVVGQTYSATGTQGNSQNYVYKHIYSYTGDQFVGGSLFVGGAISDFLNQGGIITPGARDIASSDTVGCLTSNVNSTDNFIFLDTNKNTNAGWTTAYAYFWGDENNSDVVPMESHDSTRKQFRVQVPNWAKYVIFKPKSGTTDWTNQSTDITIGNNKFFYLTTKVSGKYGVSTSAPSGYTMHFGNFTNSINGGTVEYSGYLDLKFVAYNVTSATYKIDNGASKTIKNGETIQIGEGLTNGATTKITLTYNTYNTSNTVTRTYTYKKCSYDYTATNVIKDAEVKYYKSVDVSFAFSGAISNVKYSIDSGTAQTMSTGKVVTIGNGLAEGKQTKLTVTYTFGGTEKTRTYYLLKASKEEIDLGNNYLSVNTADNASSLTSDPLLESYVNEILVNGNKGDVMRYIMGITLNQLLSYPFNVLEIQPTASVSVWNDYAGALKLADYLRIEVPAGMTASNYKDYFKVTSMSVREFNTRNEDLTGTYDLIYFGIDSGYQVVDSKGRTVYNDASMNGLVYTGIGDRYPILSFLKGTASEDYKTTSDSISNSNHLTEYNYWKANLAKQFSGNKNSSWNLNLNSGTWIMNDDASTTRLLGNDLTVKKMNELLEYVKAGYPILLPDEIYNCCNGIDGTGANTDGLAYVDVNSKMYVFIKTIKELGYNTNTNEFDGLNQDGTPIFADGKTYANIVQEKYAKYGRNPENLSTTQKFNGGLSFATKRNVQIAFTLLDCPQEYHKDTNGNPLSNGSTGTTISTSSSGHTSYRFVLQVDSNVSMEWMNANYDYQIYIDKAGTGRFDEETTIELDPRYVYNESEKQVILEGRWPGNMDGFVPWKIVAYNKNNPENHFTYTGFSAFQIPDANKKTVYILWVQTNNLTMNFSDMIKDNYSQVKEYNLKLVVIPYAKFVNAWKNESADRTYSSSYTLLEVNDMIKAGGSQPDWAKNGSSQVKISEDELRDNPEFNMLVFGYSDSYAGLDINSIAAHKNIEYFVNSGHSMLFAHDNVSYTSSLNYYVDINTKAPSNISTNWGRYSTAFLRGMLGMDVYGATYSGGSFDENNVRDYVEYLANTRKYLRDDLTQKDFRGIIETCVFKYTANNFGGNKLYSKLEHGTTPDTITDWQRTRTVRRINQGQISDYPFIIGETLNTALTHTQYMNLNMEDDDITVWYTLSCNKNATNFGKDQDNSQYYLYTEGDGSNNYYIYSKGNITYTGAGHASGATEEEKKLFINTVVAAIKAGNFQPEVVFPEAENNAKGENLVYRYVGTDDGVTIAFKAIDYDAGKDSQAFTDCKIYIDVNQDGKYTENEDIWLYYVDNNNVVHSKIVDPSTGAMIEPEFIGSALVNRKQYYFKLTDEVINQLQTDWRLGGSIYSKPIAVQVTDNGTDKDPEMKTTVSNSIWIVESKLHNLN